MKHLFLSCIAVFAMVSCSNAQENFSDKALKESLYTLNDRSTTLADILAKHKGKTIVIEVWASWCGDCVKAMPQLKSMQAAHPEVDYVFISMDKTTDKWKEGVEKHQLKGAHFMAPDGMKGKFGTAIDLDWIPRYIIIDKNGKIVTYRAIEKDFDAMDTTLNALKS